MVFTSIPPYLDNPNWPSKPSSEQGHFLHSDERAPPFLPPSSGVELSSGSINREHAKLPLPETGIKCPRCESTKTKFCYFNNYSLTQPRHYCKSCRRYWTRGGALRNVPVGGGCRRNKKQKTAQSKTGLSRFSSVCDSKEGASLPVTFAGHSFLSSQLPIIRAFHQFSHYGVGSTGQSFVGHPNDIGLMRASSLSGGEQQLALAEEHLPFNSEFDPLQQKGPLEGNTACFVRSGSSDHLSLLKIEDNEGRQLVSAPENTQYWINTGPSWNDLF